MSLYFFNLVDSHGRREDRKGANFDDLQGAIRAAESAAREFLVKQYLNDQDPDGRQFEINDEKGNLVSTVRFRDMLPPCGSH